MRSERWTFNSYRRPPLRVALAVIAAVGVASLLRLIPGISTTVAALVYVLAVVGATALGGQIAGLIAAPLSFLALNFFFTAPRYTFRVSKTEDLLALVVFLVVAVTVGTLLSLALSSRDRLQLRELEARMMSRLSTHLLSGEPTEEGLQHFAQDLVEMFDLDSCAIETVVTPRPITASAITTTVGGARLEVPIIAKGRSIGALSITGNSQSLSAAQRDGAQTLARQLAVALEGSTAE